MRRLLLPLVALACTRPPPATDSGYTPDADADTDADADADVAPVRVLTWNVEGLGAVGSDEYDAVLSVLARLDADVVALNEVDSGDEDDLHALAEALGYPTVVFPPTNPFGSIRNAMMTRLPLRSTTTWTSAVLSGDGQANDLTRLPITMEVDTPSGSVAVVGQHWQSGFYDIDVFRRAVDAIRTAQAADRAATDHVVVMGDVNAELDEPESPSVWTSLPSGAPSAFWLGSDLYGALDGPGLVNDAFAPYYDLGLAPVDALQGDGRDGTRDASGRRLDHVFVDGGLQVRAAEVYDARDEGKGPIVKVGEVPDRGATEIASDHFPVVVDLAE